MKKNCNAQIPTVGLIAFWLSFVAGIVIAIVQSGGA